MVANTISSHLEMYLEPELLLALSLKMMKRAIANILMIRIVLCTKFSTICRSAMRTRSPIEGLGVIGQLLGIIVVSWHGEFVQILSLLYRCGHI